MRSTNDTRSTRDSLQLTAYHDSLRRQFHHHDRRQCNRPWNRSSKTPNRTLRWSAGCLRPRAVAGTAGEHLELDDRRRRPLSGNADRAARASGRCLIRGDRLEVVNADTPHAAVTVVGRPAHFEGRGLGLTGPNINLNRGTNRLWIDGAGQHGPAARRAICKAIRRSAGAGALTVDWQQRMEFDGRTAQFEQAVVANAGRQTTAATLKSMEVQLQQPIRFADAEDAGAAAGRRNSMPRRRVDRKPHLRPAATTRPPTTACK